MGIRKLKITVFCTAARCRHDLATGTCCMLPLWGPGPMRPPLGPAAPAKAQQHDLVGAIFGLLAWDRPGNPTLERRAHAGAW